MGAPKYNSRTLPLLGRTMCRERACAHKSERGPAIPEDCSSNRPANHEAVAAQQTITCVRTSDAWMEWGPALCTISKDTSTFIAAAALPAAGSEASSTRMPFLRMSARYDRRSRAALATSKLSNLLCAMRAGASCGSRSAAALCASSTRLETALVAGGRKEES
eukprot:scaffold121620_cov28-Tisochrysis_lutea.AAC.1